LNLSYNKFALLLMISLILMISLMTFMLFQTFKQPRNSSVSVSYGDFLSMVESGSIIEVTIRGGNISGLSAQGPFVTFAPKDPELINLLKSKGVKIEAWLKRGPALSGPPKRKTTRHNNQP